MTEKKPARKRRRAHNTDGTFKSNNPETPDVNEAFEPIELPVVKEERDYSVKQKVDGMSSADAGKYASQPKVRPTFGTAKTIQH